MIYRSKALLLTICFVAACSSAIRVGAVEGAAGNSPAGAGAAGASSGSGSPAAGKTLTGGVQTVTISLERLRDAGLDLKQVMSAARHLYDEVNIRPVTLVEEPEIIGTAVIQIPISTQPIGPPEPPRKDRVDRAMNEMTPAILAFKKNADEFVAGDKQIEAEPDAKQKLQPLVNDWIADVNNLSQDLSQLQQLTAGPPYDNASISNACVCMQKDVKELDRVRGEAYKVIRHEGKRKHFW